MPAARRRIALVAPPWYTVPPHGYGGTELVVGLLASELRAQGHDVLLFAAQGSALATHPIAPRQWSAALGSPDERFRELTYAARVIDGISDSGSVDVIHDHSGAGVLFGLALQSATPIVHTVHGAIDEPVRTFLEALPRRVGLIAISRAQRASAAHLPWITTVHNAVDVLALHAAQPAATPPYLLCLARVCHAKGQHLAIEVARRTGHRLILAGKIESTGEARDYYDRWIAPAVDGDKVVHLHNVVGDDKALLLAGAAALLAPLQWEEPFGLYMAEAMASGTPVIAFARGSAAELIQPGETGFLVASLDEMSEAVPRAARIDRERCARQSRARFRPEVMANGYLRAYQQAINAQPAPGIHVDPDVNWLPVEADSEAGVPLRGAVMVR